VARPSDYTQDITSKICERIADGESLRSICSEEGMPDKATVFRWLAVHEAFRDQYARARETQADSLFDEILAIADDGSNDWMLRKRGDSEAWVENGEAIRRSQLRVDARKWMAGKLQPKKYGDKIVNELTGKDGGAIETKDVSGLDLARRIAFALASAKPAED
jgi:hypothetical protein